MLRATLAPTLGDTVFLLLPCRNKAGQTYNISMYLKFPETHKIQ